MLRYWWTLHPKPSTLTFVDSLLLYHKFVTYSSICFQIAVCVVNKELSSESVWPKFVWLDLCALFNYHRRSFKKTYCWHWQHMLCFLHCLFILFPSPAAIFGLLPIFTTWTFMFRLLKVTFWKWNFDIKNKYARKSGAFYFKQVGISSNLWCYLHFQDIVLCAWAGV